MRGLVWAGKEALLALNTILGVPGIVPDNIDKRDLVARLCKLFLRNLSALPLTWPACVPSLLEDVTNVDAYEQISKLSRLDGASKEALVVLAATLGVPNVHAQEHGRPQIISHIQKHLRKHCFVLPLTWPKPVAWTLSLQRTEGLPLMLQKTEGLAPIPDTKVADTKALSITEAEIDAFINMDWEPTAPVVNTFGSHDDTTELATETLVQESVATSSGRTGGEEKRCRCV